MNILYGKIYFEMEMLNVRQDCYCVMNRC